MERPAYALYPRRMVSWILAVLGLFVLQTLLPPSIRYLSAKEGLGARLGLALGPRDVQPPMPPLGARAQRALANLGEAMPVFLTLALLHLHFGLVVGRGPAVFFVARVLYVPAYLTGVPGVRSAVWVGSWVGLAMMLAPFLR